MHLKILLGKLKNDFLKVSSKPNLLLKNVTPKLLNSIYLKGCFLKKIIKYNCKINKYLAPLIIYKEFFYIKHLYVII